jgi:hypothetical protein
MINLTPDYIGANVMIINFVDIIIFVENGQIYVMINFCHKIATF